MVSLEVSGQVDPIQYWILAAVRKITLMQMMDMQERHEYVTAMGCPQCAKPYNDAATFASKCLRYSAVLLHSCHVIGLSLVSAGLFM